MFSFLHRSFHFFRGRQKVYFFLLFKFVASQCDSDGKCMCEAFVMSFSLLDSESNQMHEKKYQIEYQT